MLNKKSARSRRHLAILTIGVGVLGAGVAGSNAAGLPDPAASESPLTAQPTVAVAQLDPALTESFALFREHRASAPPASVTAQVAGPTRYGRNPSFARRIHTATGTGWVVPGDGYLCIVVPDPVDGYGTSCNLIEDVVRRGLAIELRGGTIPAGYAAQTRLLTDEQAAAATKERRPSVIQANGVASATVSVDDVHTITRGEP